MQKHRSSGKEDTFFYISHSVVSTQKYSATTREIEKLTADFMRCEASWQISPSKLIDGVTHHHDATSSRHPENGLAQRIFLDEAA